MKLKVTIDVALSALVPPSEAHVAVTAKMRGGDVKADGAVQLESKASSTSLRCVIGVEPSAMIATLAGKNLPATARSLLGDFWRTFAERVVAAPASRPR
jgi:carbon monoxide dehydrogenase subunit G